jgi:hypothetical protein
MGRFASDGKVKRNRIGYREADTQAENGEAGSDMPTFIVKHDFKKYQPRWIGDYVRLFGKNNEGSRIQAETSEKALEEFAKANSLNPWYLTVEKVSD